jgi:hypothetical protein
MCLSHSAAFMVGVPTHERTVIARRIDQTFLIFYQLLESEIGNPRSMTESTNSRLYQEARRAF